jgi:hypothetical protein
MVSCFGGRLVRWKWEFDGVFRKFLVCYILSFDY